MSASNNNMGFKMVLPKKIEKLSPEECRRKHRETLDEMQREINELSILISELENISQLK